ncbi:MAG: glycosyltransferase family 39 protein [Elusimicrobia bacterium]|nr:glycosyltransferase family 39 protein [Elusimicrobiota bacterium]
MTTEAQVSAEFTARPVERVRAPGVDRVRVLIYAFLVLALSAGLFLRLHNLDRFGYWTDELFHVLAAKSYLESGTLTVPTVGEYTRARPITYITAAAFKLLGESEASARFPFVLFNMAFIGTGFLILRKCFSEGEAVLFAVVMSFSPFAVILSRECRMYTLFQWLYFSGSMAFLMGFESGPRTGIRSLDRKWEINLPLLLLSAGLFLAATSIHPLTFNFVFVLFTYSLAMAVHHLRPGRRSPLLWKYLAALVCIGLGFAFVRVFMGDYFQEMLLIAREVPNWANRKAGDHGYYRYFLSDEYPAFFFLYPLGAFLCVKQYGKRGVFLLMSFAVLFVMHSFVFGRKGDRYIFYIFPFFVMTAAPAVLWVLRALAGGAAGLLAAQPRAQRILFVVLALPALNLLAYPWLGNSKKVIFSSPHTNWKSLPEDVKEEARLATVLTPNPMAYSYYFKAKPAYYLPVDENYRVAPGLVEDGRQMMEIAQTVPNLLIIADESKFRKEVYFSKESQGHIRSHMDSVAHRGDPAILIFRKIGGAQTASSSQRK